MSQTYRPENKTGANLTGTNGTANRTYTLAYSNYAAGTMQIHLQSNFIYEGTDYSIAGQVITFLGIVYDADLIRLDYYTSDGVVGSTGIPSYATTLQLAQMLGIENKVPTWDVGTAAASISNEDLGTVSGSGAIAYLAHRNVLASSYTLYTGGITSQTATTALTETTHYLIDKSTGKIIYTAAGATLVGVTNHVYGAYSYVSPAVDFSDAFLATVLSRAQAFVNSELNTSFFDGTASNPTPNISRNETYLSGGWFNRNYKIKNLPLYDISSALATSIIAGDTSLSVTAGDGVKFPTSGYIILGTEIISYTGISTDTLTGLTRGVNSSTAAAHTAGDSIHTTIAEVSNDMEGNIPSWNVMSWQDLMYASNDSQNLYIYDNVVLGPYSTTLLTSMRDVPNRVRFNYLYGNPTIPNDITRLTLIIAKRQLIADNIGRAMISGRNEFQPQMFNADKDEIDTIMDNYRILDISNT